MKRRTLALLALILLAAFFLRTYRLSERGLLVEDEAGYYAGPATAATHARWRVAAGGDKSTPSGSQKERLAASLESAGAYPGLVHGTKPLYGFLAIWVFFLFGPSPVRLLWINAVLGAGTVALVFWLARRLGRSGGGALFSALALALSGFHLIWSRSALSQASATFFLALGVACYAEAVWGSRRNPRRWLLGAGLSLGAGVAAHPVLGFYIGACFLAEGYRMVREGGVRNGLGNLALLGFGVGLVLALMQGLILAARWTLLPESSWMYGERIPTYLDGLLKAKGKVMDSEEVVLTLRGRLSSYLFMPFLYGEGVVFSLLALVGLGITARRFRRGGSPQEFFLLLAVLLPLVLFATVRVKAFPRNVGPLAPFVALLAGVALERCWVRTRRAGWRWAGVGLFLLIQGLHAAYLFEVRSGYASAAEWLRRNGAKGVLFSRFLEGGGLLYVNGFRDVAYGERVRPDGRLEAAMLPWKRSVSLAGRDPDRYAGLVGAGPAVLNGRDRAWLSLFDLREPVAKYPNPREFTRKKIELLTGVRWVTRRMGPRWAAEWVEDELREEQKVVASGTISLYRMRAP